MSRRRVPLLAAATFFLAAANQSSATNTSFLPGDAFFHTELDTERLDRLEQEPSPVFEYRPPRNVGFVGCGYAGFDRLKYEDMPLALRQNLVRVGRHIRRWESAIVRREMDPETGEVSEYELNAPHLFIYNPDFRGTVGLKFNENWMEHTARYESFVTDYRMIAEDWKRSPSVAPLEVETPFDLVGGKKEADAVDRSSVGKTITPMGGPIIEEPVIIRGPRTLIVIPRRGSGMSKVERELNDVALRRRGAVMYVVTVEGITGRRVRHGDWEDFDPFADVEEPTAPTETDGAESEW